MLQLKYKCLTVSFLLLKEIQTEAHQSVMQSNIKSKSPQHANSNTLYCRAIVLVLLFLSCSSIISCNYRDIGRSLK